MRLNFCCLIFVVVFKINAQDVLFTNTPNSLIYLNPSFAGSNGNIRYQSIYRNQWPNLSSSYVTLYNGFDMYLKPIKGGIGITWINDNQANSTLITDRIDLTYAQHFSLLEGKLRISPSLQATYLQKQLDRTKLSFGSEIYQSDPGIIEYVTPSQTKRNVDFSSGLLINYKHFYFGTSVFHINQPDEGLFGSSKLPARLSMFASYNLLLKEDIVLYFLARFENQRPFSFYQVIANALLFKHFIAGVGYKYYDNPFVNIGYRNKYFTICGSYEMYLKTTNTYGYELTASFNLRNKEQRKIITDFERW
jgi:type IX secretion system PorP/SprF family membrane protein